MLLLDSVRHEIQKLSVPFATHFNLTKLSAHSDLLVASALSFWTLHIVIAPQISKRFFPNSYGKFTNNRDKYNWNSRVVALTHAVLILPIALSSLNSEALERDKAYGWDENAGITAAIASGYFLWDTCESLIHLQDIGFIIHALSCLFIFLLAFQPFMGYYGARFLIWELSTPFLNIHWFLDKMNMTGSNLQLINGILLISTFIGARLIYGTIMSYRFFHTIFDIRNDLSVPYVIVFCGGNIALNTLNWYWLMKMISALRRRFSIDSGSKKSKAQ